MRCGHEHFIMSARVYLVGAGPGDPDLLTVRALRLLQQADVVVHDALVDDRILDLVPAAARLIDVGKRPGFRIEQDFINSTLLDLAVASQSYACIVRLKGGDPYVFGRGGEEAEVLLAAGVAVEVVPGVSSAFAAAAAVGIPVTHRGVSPAVTVVTGHRRDGESEVDWVSLAKAGSTLVVLMGVAERESIAVGLLAGGLSPDLPVAIVERATRPDQHVTRGRLAELSSLTAHPPAVIVIGAVAAIEAATYAVSQCALVG
jgi:uroporphyrin-III C-methyltransferase